MLAYTCETSTGAGLRVIVARFAGVTCRPAPVLLGGVLLTDRNCYEFQRFVIARRGFWVYHV
jgi:hypothetical protein